MTALSCFRLRSPGSTNPEFADLLEDSDLAVTEHDPIEGQGFVAQLYTIESYPHDPRWAPFLRSGFGAGLTLSPVQSPSALLLVRVRIRRRDAYFAFTFGLAARFLLRGDVVVRGYGLRTALNLMYPGAAESTDQARVRSVDAKRRGPRTTRSRTQATTAAEFEVFDVDRFRDIVSAATGVPHDAERWGRRVSGGDALSLDLDVAFERVGQLCREIETAHNRHDYRKNFGWIDDIKPVTDPELRERLQQATITSMLATGGSLDLAPPEVIDWERASSFHYHFDRRGRTTPAVTHPDLRLADYLTGIRYHGLDAGVDVDTLRQRRIDAVDASGAVVHSWPVWKCLVGEVQLDGITYVLDEGEFFSVRTDYIAELNSFINAIERHVALPSTTRTTEERQYNLDAAAANPRLLVMDRQNVAIPRRTTPVEICDLLSDERELIHVKRHLGSSDLSHLFAQGYVSAELLQSNAEFRQRASEKVDEVAAGRPGFGFLSSPSLAPQDFTVVFAVVAAWNGRGPVDALPFFSKVNLRRCAEDLRVRGFRVKFGCVDAA